MNVEEPTSVTVPWPLVRSAFLTLFMAMAGLAIAQHVVSLGAPAASVFWDIAGSATSVEFAAFPSTVKSVSVAIMYQSRPVHTASIDTADGDLVLTIDVGAIEPGFGPSVCTGGVLVFMHYQRDIVGGEGNHARSRPNGGLQQECVPIDELIGVSERPSASLEQAVAHDVGPNAQLPLDTWLMFGATDVSARDHDASNELLTDEITYFVRLSTSPSLPLADSDLPPYTAWDDTLTLTPTR